MIRAFIAACALAVLSGCAPDPFLGSFNFSMTGTDTNTAPTTSTASPTGVGTIAVTEGVSTDYVIVLGQTDANACTLKGAKTENKPLVLTVTADQKCTFQYAGGSATATISQGTVTLDSSTHNTATMELTYSYAGTTLGINYAGTGKRTYVGTRF